MISFAAAAIVASENKARAQELAVSMEHAFGLATEHAHGQAMWPLEDGDEALIREALALLPADGGWTWEPEDPDENGSYTWGLLRMLHLEDSRQALVLHMLHRHGLAPLMASRAGERWAAHLGDFAYEAADAAGLDARADTRQLKLLVLAELAFPPIADLRQVLEQISLNGLRNLHSYDHGGRWRCIPEIFHPYFGPMGGGGGATTQVSADAATLQWMREAVDENQSCARVQNEFYGMLDNVVSEAWHGRGGMHNGFFSVGSGRSNQAWGAIAPIEGWVTANDIIGQVYFNVQDHKCEASGKIIWDASATARNPHDTKYESEYSVPMYDDMEEDEQRAKCDSLRERYNSGDAGKQEVTQAVNVRVRAYVDTAVNRHRALVTENRAAAFAHEECDLRNAAPIPEEPRLPSACPGSVLETAATPSSSAGPVRGIVVRSTGTE